MNLSWSSGNGDKTLIIASQTALTSNPVNGSAYTSSSIYGNGSLVANGYVVFNGPSSTNSFQITKFIAHFQLVHSKFHSKFMPTILFSLLGCNLAGGKLKTFLTIWCQCNMLNKINHSCAFWDNNRALISTAWEKTCESLELFLVLVPDSF